jgi:hypothetical protein
LLRCKQATIHDLLPTKDDTVTYEANGGPPKEFRLEETDPTWKEYRHKHIATVSGGRTP